MRTHFVFAETDSPNRHKGELLKTTDVFGGPSNTVEANFTIEGNVCQARVAAVTMNIISTSASSSKAPAPPLVFRRKKV